MHVDDIKQALANGDVATIRNGFVALVTEGRVAGLATANGMALLEEVAAALKDDSAIIPSQACDALGIAAGSRYGVGVATVQANRHLWAEYFAAVHKAHR